MKKNSYMYPPYLYLLQVAEHCPKAVMTYMLLWEGIKKDNKISVYKSDVRNEYLISLSKFRHDLLLLLREGLININETPKSLEIELVGWDGERAGKCLC